MVQRSVQDKLALLRQHDDGVPWTRIATESGVPLRTLTHWSAKYRADPTSRGVQRPKRINRGTRRIVAELVEAIEALALCRPEPTGAFVYRRVNDIARERGLTAPSYPSVRTIIATIDPALRTLAQHGDAAYRDQFGLVFRRTATRPNEQWQADHTLLDIEILDKAGASVRPWLTVVLDDYSRAVAGYTVFIGAPTVEQTALALHQAVNRKTNTAWPVSDLPDVLYRDHGSDFTSTGSSVCIWTRTSNSYIRGLVFHRVGGRSSGSTALSPPNSYRTCPGTSCTERTVNPSHLRR